MPRLLYAGPDQFWRCSHCGAELAASVDRFVAVPRCCGLEMEQIARDDFMGVTGDWDVRINERAD